MDDLLRAWEAIWAFAKPLLELALVIFAATQLYLHRARERERQRVAYTALYAEYWRIVALHLELKDEDLVTRARVGGFDPGLLRPQDWGTIIQLMGEVSSTTAAFGGYAYARLNYAVGKGYALVNVARDVAGDNPAARKLEGDCKRGLHEAVDLFEDAFKGAPTWLGRHEFSVVDATSPLGQRVQEMLLTERTKLRGSRHEPRLGFVGKHLGNWLARIARWFNPGA